MRKRIYRISEDKFDDPKPNIALSYEKISEKCYVNDSYKGVFTITSENDVPLRGMVYCSNPYVVVENPQFEGTIAGIEYSTMDINMKVGESLSGEFTIVVYGAELVLPFEITFIKRPIFSSLGEINTLEEFASLAQSRYGEAMRIFYSEEFASFISDMDKDVKLLYRGFRAAGISQLNLDEFLAACNLKQRMVFDVDESPINYYGVCENIRGEIELTRSSWGFIEINVSCDAPFVSVEKSLITSEFFLGSVFTMSYYVHKDKLHDGKNYAKISFDFRGIHKDIVIMATKDGELEEKERPSYVRDKKKLLLCRNYEEFRLRRIPAGRFCQETLEMLESLSQDIPENLVMLYKAQVYIINKQRQEALWIIQDLKRSISDKRSSYWAYLLYLCTLIEREESYVNRLTEEIESIFKEHPEDVSIFWFLLFLRQEYVKNPTAKLRAIAEWIMDGHETPFLYLEAYSIFLQDPYLLSAFDDFTLKVLGYAKKHNALTKDIAIQMGHILESERVYNPKALPILEKCYEIYPDMQFLLSIATYLLKANEPCEDHFKWYAKAVENNLHVAGIFEAYVNTMPLDSVEKLPQIVTMFFRYNNNLSWERKSLLYANIILHKDEDLETYKEYERAIESFAVDMMRAKRIDENLLVCYQRLLEIGLIDENIAKLVAEFAFKKKVVVVYPDIRRIYLYQDEFTAPSIAPVKGGVAYLTYIGTEGKILLEDNKGRLIADDYSFMIEDVLDTTGHLERMRRLSPLNKAFVIHDFESREFASDFTLEDMDGMEMFLDSKDIHPEYKRRMYPKIIEYLCHHNREDIIEKHFIKDANLKSLDEKIIADVIDVFIMRGKYDEAYYMLKNVNGSLLRNDSKSKLCQYMIAAKDEAIDDFLISLCATLVQHDEIRREILAYLMKYYVGPTDLMIKIFEYAYEMNMDTVDFSERILIQSLYRDSIPAKAIEIFDCYMTRRTNRMIVEAFLTHQAHSYLAFDEEVPELIFSYILSRYKKGQNLNESMRVGLMKYMCLLDRLDNEEYLILDELIEAAILRNQYFVFYSKCDRRLQVKYHLYDKTIIEFRTDRHQQIVITYSVNDSSPVEDEMIEMYDGLYVKQFILFYGDSIKYEIYCDDMSDEPLEKNELVVSDDIHSGPLGRYSMLNNIDKQLMYDEKDDLLTTVKEYQGLDLVTKELFNMV